MLQLHPCCATLTQGKKKPMHDQDDATATATAMGKASACPQHVVGRVTWLMQGTDPQHRQYHTQFKWLEKTCM